jgi:hypothetical protein
MQTKALFAHVLHAPPCPLSARLRRHTRVGFGFIRSNSVLVNSMEL